jgi:hypothetical protein
MKEVSYSETTSDSSGTEEDEWAPPGGSAYVAHRERVYGGGNVPWATGLDARARATHDSTVALGGLDAAQEAMASAFDALQDAMDEHVGDESKLPMLREMIIDVNLIAGRLKALIARIESDPYHAPITSWRDRSRRWGVP